jgi:hypothetical protein
MSNYRLDVGQQRIVWGTRLEVAADSHAGSYRASVTPSAVGGGWEWDLPNGIYTARGIVEQLGVLLEAICVHLGEAANLEALLVNIEHTLALSGRETALPLDILAPRDHGRKEIAAHAGRVGETLAKWAREIAGQRRGLKELGVEVLGRLAFRSKCDNHLWTHEVTGMLTGPAGGPIVMQLFNEYLHQMVLLRDALLPFQNWEEVPIALPKRQNRGLRYTEEAHVLFLSTLLARPLDHQSLVRYAASLLAPGLDADGYGFQYPLGTILPASLGAELAEAPRYLLRWHPVKTVEPAEGEAIAFVSEYSDYYSAPRTLTESGARNREEAAAWEIAGEATLQAELQDGGKARIAFRLHAASASEADSYRVDLGQIFRGHRYHYRARAATAQRSVSTPIEAASGIVRQDAGVILSLPGLVTSEAGTHLIETGGHELLARALLGKLYPENVILLERGDAEELEAAKQAGKQYGAKFLLLLGQGQVRLSSAGERSSEKLSI